MDQRWKALALKHTMKWAKARARAGASLATHEEKRLQKWHKRRSGASSFVLTPPLAQSVGRHGTTDVQKKHQEAVNFGVIRRRATCGVLLGSALRQPCWLHFVHNLGRKKEKVRGRKEEGKIVSLAGASHCQETNSSRATKKKGGHMFVDVCVCVCVCV